MAQSPTLSLDYDEEMDTGDQQNVTSTTVTEKPKFFPESPPQSVTVSSHPPILAPIRDHFRDSRSRSRSSSFSNKNSVDIASQTDPVVGLIDLATLLRPKPSIKCSSRPAGRKPVISAAPGRVKPTVTSVQPTATSSSGRAKSPTSAECAVSSLRKVDIQGGNIRKANVPIPTARILTSGRVVVVRPASLFSIKFAGRPPTPPPTASHNQPGPSAALPTQSNSQPGPSVSLPPMIYFPR
jgi:hypothetical protein